MDSILIQKIAEKVKLLPNNLAEEVLLYIELLLSKNDQDWYDNLSKDQKESIERGLNDIKNGNVFTHDSVMEEMEVYLKSKQK
jgi:predicted transcriptional regulator